MEVCQEAIRTINMLNLFFLSQVLKATQLSESVVVLSLKYIAMLLQNNPNIQGAEGSEYRLFTVALMLGRFSFYVLSYQNFRITHHVYLTRLSLLLLSSLLQNSQQVLGRQYLYKQNLVRGHQYENC
jgi:hypothetical protein